MTHFIPTQFTPTQFDTAGDKAEFANNLAAFILGGFKWKDFTDKVYQKLSNCFGHIAHFNRRGFYDKWFSDEASIREWFAWMQGATPVGSPSHTYSDVEREIQSWFAVNLADIQQVIAAYGEEESAVAEQAGSEVEFCIVAISATTGDFGHREHIVVGRNGAAFKGYRQPKAHGADRDLVKGEIFTWEVDSEGMPKENIFETRSPMPDKAPQGVIDEVFADAA